jgi:hypothetical protein
MNMALAGLTAREEVAMGMLVGKSLPGWQCSAVPAGPDVSLPPADLYVVDLAGRGLARWTEAAQSDLLNALGGAPAVLVVPAFDQTWSALDAERIKSQPLVLLHKPYGTEDMRAALKQAAAGCASRTAPAVLPVAVPVVVASASLPVAPTESGAMTSREFQAFLAALPESEPQLFLRKLAEALALRQPFEVRVSFVSRLIFDPAGQWVASNTPVSALEYLCQSDALASAIEFDAIDDKGAMGRAQRLGISIQPLASFLWQLAQGRLGNKA